MIFFLPSGILPSFVMMIWSAVTEATLPLSFGDDDRAGIARDLAFQAGADERRFGHEQRHALALHVRTHQRAVGVVVLEERNQAGGHRNELLRRNVHVIDLRRLDVEEVAAVTDGNLLAGELAFVVDRRVRLRDDEILFAVGGEIIDLLGHAAVFDFAVRRFDEAEIVDARERRQRADQTDVRTFRRFDRANAAVVRRMNVADFEARAIAARDRQARGPTDGACASVRPAD